MSDRELLEMAAKAAGIGTFWYIRTIDGYEWRTPDNRIIDWNPLADDGDALRLAVQLGIADLHNFYDGDASDPYAATRRAIVRAAAEIGGTM